MIVNDGLSLKWHDSQCINDGLSLSCQVAKQGLNVVLVARNKVNLCKTLCHQAALYLTSPIPIDLTIK